VSDETISFDRAAEFYDATRDVGDEATAETIDYLAASLEGRGRVLEIGVGTGILALPLVTRGHDVVGIDVSTAMLAKLRRKAGAERLRLLEADARSLPFPDGAFAAAYLRHVLHLIPGWTAATGELCRVVEPGGPIMVDAGRASSPEWREFWAAIAPALGPEAEPPGLDLTRDGEEALNEGLRAAGAQADGMTSFWYPGRDTWADVIEEMERRSPSWTWRVPDEAMERAVELGRRFVLDRHGSLDPLVSERFEVRWYRYLNGRSN
jgi:SAM-dependent methyltransferase